jgi:hypothetical protein
MDERINAQPASRMLVRGELSYWVHVGRVVGVIALVVGVAIGFAGPPWGWIIAAVGAMLWLWLEAVAFQARWVRTWLTMEVDGFVAESRTGRREVKDTDVVAIALATKRNFSNADVASVTRTLRVWTEREPEPVIMHGKIKTGQEEPLAMLIYRLHEAVVLRLSQELQRGLTIVGDGWQMNRIGLSVGRPPADTLLPLAEITAVEQFDGKLCVWRRGQDEAAAKLDPGGRNTYVLPALLAPHIEAQDGRAAAGAAGASGLGRILFQRRPSNGVVLGFLVAGVFLLLIGAVLLVPGMAQMAALLWALALLLLGMLAIPLGIWMRSQNFRVHERGVWQSNLFGQKVLRYEDVGTFKYQAMDHYHNGAYVGTHLTMDFRPISKEFGPRIRYNANIRGRDDDLESLRDEVSRAIAANMAELYNAGQPVFWTSNLQFLPEGIRYRPAGMLGMGRKEPQLLPYDQYGGYDFQEGVFRLFARNNSKPVCTEPTSAENFFPGYFLLLLLLHTPADDAPPELL